MNEIKLDKEVKSLISMQALLTAAFGTVLILSDNPLVRALIGVIFLGSACVMVWQAGQEKNKNKEKKD